MVAYTITVPPTVALRTFSESGSMTSSAYVSNDQETNTTGAEAESGITRRTLGNGNVVIDFFDRGFATYGIVFAGTNANENTTYVQEFVNTEGVITSSYDGNVIGSQGAITTSLSSYVAQSTSVANFTQTAYSLTTTTSQTTTGTIVSSLPGTTTTSTEVQTTCTTQGGGTSIGVFSYVDYVTAYNGQTGIRDIATVVFPESNERVWIPRIPATSGIIQNLQALQSAAEIGDAVIYPRLLTIEPLLQEQVGETSETAFASAIPSSVSATMFEVATNTNLIPSPLADIEVLTIAQGNAQQYITTNKTLGTGGQTVTRPSVVTSFVSQEIMGVGFDRSINTTVAQTIPVPIGETYTDSGFIEGGDGFFEISFQSRFTYERGETITPFSYAKLSAVPNGFITSYASSLLSARATPANLSLYGKELRANVLTVATPDVVLANQSAFLPRPNTQWNYVSTQSSVTTNADGQSVTLTLQLSVTASADGQGVTLTRQLNEEISTESGAWQLEGEPVTTANAEGKWDQQRAINPGGKAATGNATVLYGPGIVLTTNTAGESGQSFAASVRRVVLQSSQERTAFSAMSQFVGGWLAAPNAGAFYTTATRNPTGHIMETAMPL
jgi:hypothetical protein